MRKKYVVQRNADLERKQITMEERIAAIETSPVYGIAKELKIEVDNKLRQGVGVDTALDAAIQTERQKLFATRVKALTESLVEKALAAQRSAIEQEAMSEAEQRARAELKRFQAEDADAYREQARETLARQMGARLVDQARREIREEEQQRLLGNAMSMVEAQEAQKEYEKLTRERNKLRAKGIRLETKKNGILRYGLLAPEDVVTIGFTEKGKGFEALTEGYYGSSSYRSSLEMRRLTCAVVDAGSGLFEVYKDSWSADNRKREQAIHGGSQVLIRATDPDSKELSPLIVKGSPVNIVDTRGEPLTEQYLDVWWVNLDEFRILS